MGGIVAPKGSRLLDLLDPAVARLVDSGVLAKVHADFLFRDRVRNAYKLGGMVNDAVAANEPIGLKTFERTFSIYLGCIAVAAVAFVGELVVGCYAK